MCFHPLCDKISLLIKSVNDVSRVFISIFIQVNSIRIIEEIMISDKRMKQPEL